jgi:hypothetical protein
VEIFLTPLRINADVGNAGVLRGEVVRQHSQFADGFKRWLTSGCATKDASVGTLSV